MADPADDVYEEGYGEGVWGDGDDEAAEIEEDAVDPEAVEEVTVPVEVEEAYEEYAEEQAGEDPEAESGGRKSKGAGEFYTGLVHRVGPKTGNMLIKSRFVTENYGMEAMILKGDNPSGAQLCDRVKFKVVERDGQRPLAASVKIIGKVDEILPDKGKGKGKGKKGGEEEAKGKSKGKGKEKKAGSSAGPGEIAFAGVVSSQSDEHPYKFSIDCDNVSAAFGLEAWFHPNDKPANVSIGSLVAFTVNTNGHARWVCKLAPLSDSLWEAQAAAIASQDKGPPVRKTIVKKPEGKARGK